jgi:hypothetical protein
MFLSVRNCTDWYQLPDLASLCGTLTMPVACTIRDYNDRMLLGLKAPSEAQWYHMRMHLYAALLNSSPGRTGPPAHRLERTADGKIVLSADQEVQSAICLVFAQFTAWAARAVIGA